MCVSIVGGGAEAKKPDGGKYTPGAQVVDDQNGGNFSLGTNVKSRWGWLCELVFGK